MEPIFTRAKVSHLKSKEVGRHDRDREELEGGQVGCGVDEPLPAHLKRVKRVGINKIIHVQYNKVSGSSRLFLKVDLSMSTVMGS